MSECNCEVCKDNPHPARVARARRRLASGPERTIGAGSGHVRGEFIPNHSAGHIYDKGFWTHVTVSHGREVR